MKTSATHLLRRIDMWFRAHITQRAHYFRVSDKAIAYMEIDDILETVVYRLAKRYLYDELGEKTSFSPKDIDDEGYEFYKDFRLHGNDEENIDICLNYINIYNELENLYIQQENFKTYEAVENKEKELSKALLAFVEKRGSLWT